MTTKSRSNKKAFAERIGELKRERDYTVEGFAAVFAAKPNTVRDWLNARVLPRAEALCRIAAHFGVTTDWLLGMPGAPKRPKQWRTDTILEADLASAVAAALHERLPPKVPRVFETYRWEVSGAAMLAAAVAAALSDAERELARERERVAGHRDLRALTEAVEQLLALDGPNSATEATTNAGLRLLGISKRIEARTAAASITQDARVILVPNSIQ